MNDPYVWIQERLCLNSSDVSEFGNTYVWIQEASSIDDQEAEALMIENWW